ncbi:MAG: protein jag [Firmicutes bacterium]|nr:protein jag [Bacillota bacterium]
MKDIEVCGRTVEEAIQEALIKLNTTRDQVEINIIEEGNKGLFGILGSKQARVFVERKPTIEWKVVVAKDYLNRLLEKMNIEAQVKVRSDEGCVFVDISGENLGFMIGRRGQTLDALQYLTGLVVNREGGEWIRVVIDIEGYRYRREQTLRALARRMAYKVQTTGRRVALDPMNALERRIIHSQLQEFDDLETHSEGKEPFRRVIISPKK